MADGEMHTPHPIPLDRPLVMSYRNHQKSLACFSHLTPLVVFFFTKRQSQRGVGGMAQCLPKYAPAIELPLVETFAADDDRDLQN